MEIPILTTLAIALLGAFVGHRLSLGRERRSARRTAASEFHKAFADTLLNLETSDIGAPRVVREFDVRHSAAISAFRPYVSFGKRRSFEKAVARLNEICVEYRNAGPLTLLTTEWGPVATASRQALVRTIRDLLALAPLI